jgi:hypothetical protein
LRRESINVDNRQRHRELTGGLVLVVDRRAGAAPDGEIAEIPLIPGDPAAVGNCCPSELHILAEDPGVGTSRICGDIGQGR